MKPKASPWVFVLLAAIGMPSAVTTVFREQAPKRPDLQ